MEYTREGLEKAVDAVINHCLETGEPPVDFVVERLCGLSRLRLEELGRVEEDGGETEGICRPSDYRRASKRLQDFAAYFWLRRALDDPRAASFAMFNLRQPENGGYQDKPPASAPELVIRLEGVGDGAFD